MHPAQRQGWHTLGKALFGAELPEEDSLLLQLHSDFATRQVQQWWLHAAAMSAGLCTSPCSAGSCAFIIPATSQPQGVKTVVSNPLCSTSAGATNGTPAAGRRSMLLPARNAPCTLQHSSRYTIQPFHYRVLGGRTKKV